MTDHECIHEKDFGILFTKVDLMTEAFKAQTKAMDLLNTAISGILKFQWSMEAIAKNEKVKKEWTMQKAIFYSSLVLGSSGIIVTLILKFV